MSKKPRNIPEWMKKRRGKAVGNALDNIVGGEKRKNAKSQKELFNDLDNAERRNKLIDKTSHSDDEEYMSYFDTLPLVKYDGKIHYYKDFYDTAEGFDNLIKEVEGMISDDNKEIPVAFDLEWTFDYKSGPKPVAVLQICFNLDSCHIVQMSALTRIPASLTTFLNHSSIILHGVNIKNDIRKLSRDFPCFKADKLLEKSVELGDYYNNVFNSAERWSLNRLSAQTIKQQIDKSKHVRMSNWNYYPLKENQLKYAAIDVYVSFLNVYFNFNLIS